MSDTILITGGTGTIGRAILDHLLLTHDDLKAVRVLNHSEVNQARMMRQYDDKRLRFLLGDIRDYDRLLDAMHNVDVVYHCAALKHVGICEYNHAEAIRTNALGTENVLRAANVAAVRRLLHVSTDKVVLPTSMMASTKLAAEKAAVSFNDSHKFPIVVAVRFGNIMYSSGSLGEIIDECVAAGKPYPLTSPDMKRYFITAGFAAQFCVEALESGAAGDIWIPHMVEERVGDVAERMAQECAAKRGVDYPEGNFTLIGPQPGENIAEKLWTDEELTRRIRFGDVYVIPRRARQ